MAISRGAYTISGYFTLDGSGNEDFTVNVGVYFQGVYYTGIRVVQYDYEDFGDEITTCNVYLVNGNTQKEIAVSGSSAYTARVQYDNEVIEFLGDVDRVFYNSDGLSRKYYSVSWGSISRVNVNTININSYPYFYSDARRSNVSLANNEIVLRKSGGSDIGASSSMQVNSTGDYYLYTNGNGFCGSGTVSNTVYMTAYTLSTPTPSINNLRISWGGISNASSYEVYKDGVKIMSTSGLNYDVSVVGNYQVKAVSSSVWYSDSALSAGVNVTADMFFQIILDSVSTGNVTFDGVKITGVKFKEG